MNPLQYFIGDRWSSNREFINTDIRSKNYLDQKQLGILEGLDINFAYDKKNYIRVKRFTDKKFTPISKTPKNAYESVTRKYFYDAVDRHPNIIPELAKNNKLAVFIIRTPEHAEGDGAQGADTGMPGHHHIMVNTEPPNSTRTALVMFHELRHIAQVRGQVPGTKNPKSFNQTVEEWHNNPGEQDAERYAHTKLIEGKKQARPPFNYLK